MRFRGIGLAAGLVVMALPTTPAAAGMSDCEPVGGVDELTGPGVVILVGEIHGTEQSPAFVAALACAALDSGYAVTVALEIPVEERARFDEYLESAGTDADRSAMLTGPFWQAPEQDGRGSIAMVDLLERVRAWRAADEPIGIALLDEACGSGDRDRWMAEHLVEAATAVPDGITIALTGNVHTMVEPGAETNPEYQPMGQVTTELLGPNRVIALDVTLSGGTAWVCADRCGETALEGTGSPDPGFSVTLHRDDHSTGYHGEYSVGPVTASPPAVATDG